MKQMHHLVTCWSAKPVFPQQQSSWRNSDLDFFWHRFLTMKFTITVVIYLFIYILTSVIAWSLDTKASLRGTASAPKLAYKDIGATYPIETGLD